MPEKYISKTLRLAMPPFSLIPNYQFCNKKSVKTRPEYQFLFGLINTNPTTCWLTIFLWFFNVNFAYFSATKPSTNWTFFFSFRQSQRNLSCWSLVHLPLRLPVVSARYTLELQSALVSAMVLRQFFVIFHPFPFFTHQPSRNPTQSSPQSSSNIDSYLLLQHQFQKLQ